MVMKPEPWGEALDSLDLGPGGAVLVVPTPAGEPFTQAVARELAAREHLVFACGRYEGIDQRVVDDAAEPGRGARAVARRLRAQRRRGGRAGDHRGRRPAAARVHGQRRVARRGVARGRPARVPRLHQARLLARPRRPAGAALRRPRRDRPVAPRAGRPADGRPSARPALAVGAARGRRGAPRRAGRRRRAVHAAARLLAPGGAGQPRRPHPGARTSRSTTCAAWLAERHGARRPLARAAGRAVARSCCDGEPGTSAG